MLYNVCGNCDFCLKDKTNDKGQVRCALKHSFVDIGGSCPEYYNRIKEDICRSVMGEM